MHPWVRNGRNVTLAAAKRNKLVTANGMRITVEGRKALRDGAYSVVGADPRGGSRSGAGRIGAPITGEPVNKTLYLDDWTYSILREIGGGVSAASFGLRQCASAFDGTPDMSWVAPGGGHARTMILDSETIDKLLFVGDGNVSRGAKRAAAAWDMARKKR